MILIRVGLLLTLLAVNGVAAAQVCPYGAYPGRLDEPQICRPPPEDENTAPTTNPTVRWDKTWGAIAVDVSSGTAGTVTGLRSKQKAQKAAVTQCYANGGGGGCKKIALVYQNQCAVIAWGRDLFITQGAASTEEASKLALSKCTTQTEDCKIVYSECTLPIRRSP